MSHGMHIHNPLTHTHVSLSNDQRRHKKNKTTHGASEPKTVPLGPTDLRTAAAMDDPDNVDYSLGDHSGPVDPDAAGQAHEPAVRYENSVGVL